MSAIIAISDPRAYRRVRVFDLKQFFLSPLEYSTVHILLYITADSIRYDHPMSLSPSDSGRICLCLRIDFADYRRALP